jgi:hypothetical protein
MEGHFAAFLNNHSLVRHRLAEIVRPKHLPGAGPRIPHIAVHVRLGDFSVPRSAADLDVRNGLVNFRMPIEWYMHGVKSIREAVNQQIPALVYSDGRDEELASLLAMEGVTRVQGQSPMKDMLSLAEGTALIASGSTFSMWASFLGRMPVIWHPGQLRQRLYLDNPQAEVEAGLGEDLPDTFVAVLRRSFA